VAEFNGTIKIKHNPVTSWETYSHTFHKSADDKDAGYFGLSFSRRAEGGFHRASFSVRESPDFQSAFMENALGREVQIYGNEGDLVWEGYIDGMDYDGGKAVYSVDLGGMANAVWVRFRQRGQTTTERSVVQTDDDSIARFGRKEFVLSAGELESTDIPNNVALQYLNLSKWPIPTPTRINPEQELAEYPTIAVDCRGWFDTLGWCTYNQTASTDNQGATSQISTILADTDISQFVAGSELGTNSTSVSKEYDADRRGDAIAQDIARLGDAQGNRWVIYMDKGRILRFDFAAPPTEPV